MQSCLHVFEWEHVTNDEVKKALLSSWKNRSDYLSLVWPVNFLKEIQSSYSINCDAKVYCKTATSTKKKIKNKTNLQTNKLAQIVSFFKKISLLLSSFHQGFIVFFLLLVVLKFILNAQEG